MDSRTEIEGIVAFCDSMGDTGGAYNRKIAHFIPMRWLSGLTGKAPKDSFTNGLTWVDNFITTIINNFINEELKQKSLNRNDDIADIIINKDCKYKQLIHDSYSLKNYAAVKYKAQNFVRHFSEGGMSSHNYKGEIDWSTFDNFLDSLVHFPTREIVATLGQMRTRLLVDDEKNKISQIQKGKTLIIEWSGGNDLITTNKKPSKSIVDKAIKARIHNVRELIKHGYRNFILFNLPDLSITPLYRRKSPKEQSEAHHWSEYFNDQLLQACETLQKEFPTHIIDVFDVNAYVKLMYNNPEKYGFKKELLEKPFVESDEFKKIKQNKESQKKHIAPADGFFFNDPIHPTADTHVAVSNKFYTDSQKRFNFFPPEPEKRAAESKKTKDDFDFYPKSLSKQKL